MRRETLRAGIRHSRSAAAFVIAAAAVAVAAPASAHFAGPQIQLPADGGPSSMVFNSTQREYANVVDGRFGTSGPLVSSAGASRLGLVVGPGEGPGFKHTDVGYNHARDQYLVPYRAPGVPLQAELFDADGTRVRERIPVSSDMWLGSQDLDRRYAPSVAYNARARQWLIVFSVLAADGTSVVRATRLDADGVVLSSDVVVADAGVRNESPELVYRPAKGDFAMAWSAAGADGRSDVYVQRLDTSAVARGAARRVSQRRHGVDAAAPAIASTTAGGQALLAWAQGGEIRGCRLGGRSLRAQRYLKFGRYGRSDGT